MLNHQNLQLVHHPDRRDEKASCHQKAWSIWVIEILGFCMKKVGLQAITKVVFS
jgi:hypothetical protein